MYIQEKYRTSIISRARQAGYIYVIKTDCVDSPFKIGMTSDPTAKKRLYALQTSHWCAMRIVYVSSRIEKALLVEEEIHKLFEGKRLRGEWFALSSDEIAMFPRLVEQLAT